MKSIFAYKNFPLATVVFVSAAAVIAACSTAAVNNPDAGASGSATGTTGSVTGTSGSVTGTTGTVTGTTGTVTGTTGSVTGTTGTSGTVATVCPVLPSADGGFASFIDFSTITPLTDGGVPVQATFRDSTVLFGGTFFYANPADSVTSEAGVGCTLYGSQSTFSSAVDPVAKTWTLSGLVSSFTGMGVYIIPCIDVSPYTGIEFTISGSVGLPDDGGTSDQIVVQLAQLDNWNTGIGTCPLAPDGGPGTNCNPGQSSISVPATMGVPVQIPFSAFTGGTPDAIFDPSHIIQVQWNLPWPCTGGVPYTTNITLQNVGFYK